MTKATPDASKAIPSSRRILWLGIFVLVAVIAWTAGWFYVASRMEARIPLVTTAARQNGIDPYCESSEIRGFPFRFGLFCERTGLDIPENDLTASAGAFRSAAQFYRPGHVVSELDGPLTINQPGLSALIDWQLLHASSSAGDAGLLRASIEGKRVTADIDALGLPADFTASAEIVALHIRQNEGALDIAANAQSLASSVFPALRLVTLEATLPGGAIWLENGQSPETLRGRDIVLHQLRVEFARGGGLSLSGNGSIGLDGLLTGDFRLRIEDLEAVITTLAELAPDIAAQASGVKSVLLALDAEDGDNAITLPVTIRNGQASISIIPLGLIPPL